MKSIDDETLFKLVEEHLNKFYRARTDRIVARIQQHREQPIALVYNAAPNLKGN